MNWKKFFRKLGVVLLFAVCVWQWPVLVMLIVDAVVNGVVKKNDYVLKDWFDILFNFKVNIEIDPKDSE